MAGDKTMITQTYELTDQPRRYEVHSGLTPNGCVGVYDTTTQTIVFWAGDDCRSFDRASAWIDKQGDQASKEGKPRGWPVNEAGLFWGCV